MPWGGHKKHVFLGGSAEGPRDYEASRRYLLDTYDNSRAGRGRHSLPVSVADIRYQRARPGRQHRPSVPSTHPQSGTGIRPSDIGNCKWQTASGADCLKFLEQWNFLMWQIQHPLLIRGCLIIFK